MWRMDKQVYCSLVLLSIVGYIQAFQSPARKTWWAKRVLSDDYYTAGRLTVRQIKYASEDGFKSLISVFGYDSESGDDPTGQGVLLPSKTKAESTAQLAGIEHTTLTDTRDWKNVDTLNALSDALSKATKPVIVYDDNAFVSTFLLLLHFARESLEDGNTEVNPRVSAEEVFSVGASLGFDFSSSSDLVQIVRKVTQVAVSNPEKPDVTMSDWYTHFWPAKPLGLNWWIVGQIQESDIPMIQAAGFKSLINYRKGKVTDGKDTQEEVTLLNIRDRTGTYTGQGRQSKTELEKNRIDANKANEYISASSTINYESRNPSEFGDDIGYNEELERSKIPSSLVYMHLPIGGTYFYNREMWNAYGPKHQEAQDRGPVLTRCRTGFRSAVVAIIQVAGTKNKNSTWALERLEEVGYDIAAKAPTAPGLYREVLDGVNSGFAARCAFNWFMVSSLTVLLWVL